MNLLKWLEEMSYSSQRVLKISKKPTTEKYLKIITATGISILLIGVLGVILRMVMLILKGFIA